MPPLPEHREDILPFDELFIAVYNRRNVEALSPEGAYAPKSYDWPGNIRELRNAMERAMVLAESAWIGSAHVGRTSRALSSASSFAIDTGARPV